MLLTRKVRVQSTVSGALSPFFDMSPNPWKLEVMLENQADRRANGCTCARKKGASKEGWDLGRYLSQSCGFDPPRRHAHPKMLASRTSESSTAQIHIGASRCILYLT